MLTKGLPMLVLERTFEGLTAPVSGIALSPDGSLLLGIGQDKSSVVWDRATGEIQQRLWSGADRIDGAAFSLDGTLLYTAAAGALVVREARGGWKEVGRAPIGDFGLRSFALSPGGTLLAASVLGAVKLVNVSSLKVVATLPAHGYLGRPAFSPDGRTVASACKQVFLHSTSGAVEHVLEPHPSAMQTYDVSFSPDGQLLAAGGMHSSLRVWRTSDHAVAFEARLESKYCHAVAFTPDGRWLIAVSMHEGRGALELFDVATTKRVAALPIGRCPREALAVSADSMSIAIGSRKGAAIYRLEPTRGEASSRAKASARKAPAKKSPAKKSPAKKSPAKKPQRSPRVR